MQEAELKQLVYNIVGAAMEVHKELKKGLLEAVYNEALYIELTKQGIACSTEVELPIYYKGELMHKKYRIDMVCSDVIVELKAVDTVIPEHRAQLFNYLRLTQKPVGLLINFGESQLHFEKYYYDMIDNEIRLFNEVF